MRSIRLWLIAALFSGLSSAASANDRIIFGTNWTAEAEHGGFYQALAEGLYAKAGIDVVIRQGGPQTSTAQLLAAGALDFAIVSDSNIALNFVREGVPDVAIAAFFQKNPQILMAHESQGYNTLADLRGKPIMISTDAWDTYWKFLKVKYQFSDDQIRPYTFDAGPFLANDKVIMQGYLSNDVPQMKRMGIDAKIFLLADYGYDSYACLLLTSTKLIQEKPDLVKRFVDASILGWKHYLDGDPKPGDDAIIKANPDYSQEVATGARQTLIDFGVAESGDAKTNGIGTMSESRWKRTFDTMVEAGVYDKSLDWRKAFTTQFVTPSP